MIILTNSTFPGNDQISSDDKIRGILSFGDRRILDTVNYVFICGLISLFGITTNSINMVVFCRQGFKNTMTISFMALAISDISCLITLEWFCICMNPLLSNANLDFVPLELHTPLGGWPHVTFARITGWITTYITAERCLCITAPLAVRRIITPKRTVFILFLIYAVNLLVLIPVNVTSYIGWKFYPEYNRSLVGLVMTSGIEGAERGAYFMQAVIVFSFFLCVTVLTSILVIKLRAASEWRNRATGTKLQTENISTKDKKATKMVITISSLLIVLYFPSIILSFVSFSEPQFNYQGVYKNLYFAIWSFGLVFNSINSSVNIFMYYNMSTKYRKMFIYIFLPAPRDRDSIVLPLPCRRSNIGGKTGV